jgi:hypothetical protein
MSIQSVGTSALSYVGATRLNTDTTAIDTTDDTTTSYAPATQLSLSGPAELFSKLQKLEASDPSKAQAALHQLADQVREQANSVSGTQATHRNAFADKLDQAADSGDLSGLQPQHAGRAHHRHHGGGGGVPAPASDSAAVSGSQAASAYSDQAQLGGDPPQAGDALFEQLNAALDAITG